MPEEKHSTGRVVFQRIDILQEHPFGHLQNCLMYSICRALGSIPATKHSLRSSSSSGYQSQMDDTD